MCANRDYNDKYNTKLEIMQVAPDIKVRRVKNILTFGTLNRSAAPNKSTTSKIPKSY